MMTQPTISTTAAPSSAARLSISLVYYDTDLSVFDKTLSELGRALQKLARPASVMIVDNASRLDVNHVRAELEAAAGDCPIEIQLLAGHGNIGFGRGHNLALGWVADSAYHLILNPDVYLASDCLDRAVACLESWPDAVALSPYAKTADGTRQYLCKRYPDLLTLALRAGPTWLQQRFTRRIAHYELHDHSCVQARSLDTSELASGCFLLCRTDALRQVGGFDPGYFLYFEDFDLSLRLQAHGTIVHDLDSRIVHLGGSVARKSWRHWGLFLVSALRFFRTHGLRAPAARPSAAPAKRYVTRF